MKLHVEALLLIAGTIGAQSSLKAKAHIQEDLHVYASRAEWLGAQYGVSITGMIGGQALVLHTYKDVSPLLPGDYKIQLMKEETPHGAELSRRYLMVMPDGKELIFDLQALCGQNVHVCYGVSLDGK